MAPKNTRAKSFTIIEVIVAASIITVGIIGVLTLITKTVGLMSVSPSKLFAAYLAQEGVEIVRNIRDTNWVEGELDDPGVPGSGWKKDLPESTPLDAGWQADYTTTSFGPAPDLDKCPALQPPYNCHNYNATELLKSDGRTYQYLGAGMTNTIFQRKILILHDGANPDIIHLTVTVSWWEKGKEDSLSVQEDLYNWH